MNNMPTFMFDDGYSQEIPLIGDIAVAMAQAFVVLDTTEAIAINARVTCDNDSELWKIYRSEGSELESRIKKIVTEDLGSNFEAEISFHAGSFVARIAVTANECFRIAIYVINKTIRKIEELLKTFFRKAQKVAASVDWEKVSKIASTAASIWSIFSGFFRPPPGT